MPSQTNSSLENKYYSKRDAWIVGVLWAIIIFCAASAIYITFLEMSILSIVTQEILFLGVVALCFSILRSTYYVLMDGKILVRSGPFKWSIPYPEIEEVVPERNLWSSAALSRDRLHIRYESSKSGAYISPEKEEEFLIDLAGRCPHLEREGKQLIQAGSQEMNARGD